MKKIFLAVSLLSALVFSDNIDYPAAFDNTQDGDVIFFDVHVGGPFDTVANVVNGRLDNANIKTGANILPTKLDSSKTLFMRVVDADTVKNARSVATVDISASGTSGLNIINGTVGTFGGLVSVDTLKSTKGISATNANLSAGLIATTGTFSSVLGADTIRSTKGIRATNANLSAGLIATTGTFSSAVNVDTLNSTKGIKATNFTGNHIGSMNGGTTATFSGTVTVDSLKITKGINATNGSFSTKIGVGTAYGAGTAHIKSGSSGVVYDSLVDTDDLVVENSSRTGISIISADNGLSMINFGVPSRPVSNYIITNYVNGNITYENRYGNQGHIFSNKLVKSLTITDSANKLNVLGGIKSTSLTTDTIKSVKIITSDSANITKLAIANVSTGAGTFTGTVTADSIKSAKGVNATNGTFSARVSVDSLYSAKGIRGTNGTFSAQVSVDTLFSTKGIKATNFTGNLIGNVTGSSVVATNIYSVDNTTLYTEVVGWTIDSSNIYYYVVGKTVYVHFSITGTSDDQFAQFGLPYAPAYKSTFVCEAEDNGTTGVGYGTALTSGYAAVYFNAMFANWTTTGTKTITGSLWYRKS
jgi:hypothetical protein